MGKRLRILCTMGSKLVTSVVFPGHIPEEILVPVEQLLFHDILGAAWREGMILLVFDLFPEKGHGAVEMMERQTLHPVDDVVPMPPVAGPGGTGREEPVQDRQENRSFYSKAEPPVREKTMKYPANPQFLPEPLEDEGRSDLLRLGTEAVIPVGQKQVHLLGEAGKGTSEGFYLTFSPQLVHTSHGGDDPLPALPIFPVVFDDLEVFVGTGFLDSGEQGRLLFMTPLIYRIYPMVSMIISIIIGTTLMTNLQFFKRGI